MKSGELMHNSIKILNEGASLESGSAATHVMGALRAIMNLHQISHETPLGSNEFVDFKNHVVRLLKSGRNPGGLSVYVFECYNYASRGRLDGFERACYLRSALQLLNDEYAPWEQLLSCEDLDEIAEIDETLVEVSDDAPPVLEEAIPKWLPETHWWWRAPKRQDMTERERYERIYYDANDGL